MPFLGAETALGGVAGERVAVFSGYALRATRGTLEGGFKTGAFRVVFARKGTRKYRFGTGVGHKSLNRSGFRGMAKQG